MANKRRKTSVIKEFMALKITIAEKSFVKVDEYQKICNFFGLQCLCDKDEIPEQVKALFKGNGIEVKECCWTNAFEMFVKASKNHNDENLKIMIA